MSFIMTYTGVRFPLIKPEVRHFKLVDIAHALSLVNRYGGHTKYRYSVALHCLLGAEKMLEDGLSYRLQLLFMLHDAPEAYYGDIPKPLKVILGDVYASLEDYALERIWEAFGIEPPTEEEWEIVKEYDSVVFANEFPVLMVNPSGYDVEPRNDGLRIMKEDEAEVELAYMLTVNELLKRVIYDEKYAVHN
jgi:5'-deoxynucleotidase YfbR-like HD superfamily hydrolase